MSRSRRASMYLLVTALGLAAIACPSSLVVTGPDRPSPSVTNPNGTGPTPTGPTPTGDGSAPNRDCDREVPSPAPQGEPEPLPPVLQEVADEVSEIRGLEFVGPISPQAISQDEIVERLQASIDRSFPLPLMEARGQAWATMGVIPDGTDLGQTIRDYFGTQVVGFYDTISHELVFIGEDDPSPYQRLILSHELTHALDDQHFDLRRLDLLEAACLDEELVAFLALGEGSAQTHEQLWAIENLTPQELLEVAIEAGSFEPPPDTVPPFLQETLIFPYPAGQQFVQALLARGGQEALDEAFRNPPVSTEQIIHPDRYPDDTPVGVGVADAGPGLGVGWQELDALDVGESWLDIMLGLEVPAAQATTAAQGWDGARYRAWGNGDESAAVVLETTWDTEIDAGEFAEAVEGYASGDPIAVRVLGSDVRVLFASDQTTLDVLESAVR